MMQVSDNRPKALTGAPPGTLAKAAAYITVSGWNLKGPKPDPQAFQTCQPLVKVGVANQHVHAMLWRQGDDGGADLAGILIHGGEGEALDKQ